MSGIKKCPHCGRYNCGVNVYEKDGKKLRLLRTFPPCKKRKTND